MQAIDRKQQKGKERFVPPQDSSDESSDPGDYEGCNDSDCSDPVEDESETEDESDEESVYSDSEMYDYSSTDDDTGESSASSDEEEEVPKKMEESAEYKKYLDSLVKLNS